MASALVAPAAAPHWQSPYLHRRQVDPAWEMAGQARESESDSLPGEPATGTVAGTGTLADVAKMPLLRVVGQVGAAYIIAEGPDGLYLIDQHAAHERILFERMITGGMSSGMGQRLITPIVVTLPPAQAATLAPQLEEMNQLGFEISEFGPNSFQVRMIPAQLAGADPAELVQVVVNDFEEDESPLAGSLRERLIGRICKRAAVKAGKSLSPQEQARLVADLEGCENPRHCPHGRPTMIHLSVDMLERQFGRRGAR